MRREEWRTSDSWLLVFHLVWAGLVGSFWKVALVEIHTGQALFDRVDMVGGSS